MTGVCSAAQWLAPLTAALPDLGRHDWEWLHEFEADLVDLAAAEPRLTAGQGLGAAWLLKLRRQLASRHPPIGAGDPVRNAVRQTLLQFICGFYDLDLRDTYGPGHGALILAAANDPIRRRWAARLAAGELVGIAATERHGGSRIQEITWCSSSSCGPRPSSGR